MTTTWSNKPLERTAMSAGLVSGWIAASGAALMAVAQLGRSTQRPLLPRWQDNITENPSPEIERQATMQLVRPPRCVNHYFITGAMLASDDEHFIAHARKLSQQAREPAPHYEHSEIGYNYRMSNIVAAIGLGQLRGLDQRVQQKRCIFEQYKKLLGDLPGIEFMPEAPYARSNRWLTVILVDQDEFGARPDEIRIALEGENIESRPIWKPMHLQPVFHGCRFRGNGVSEDLFRKGLCLPSGTALTDSDLERITGIIRRLHR
jgi:dTDP-4-amino-4,6-dideoxygalactose transaminase